MTVRTNVAGASDFVLQESIGAYADEAYTAAKKLSGTGIVSSNDMIDTSTETYVGQLRWNKPLTQVINIASLTDATDGTPSNYSQDYLTYVKTVRTGGATKVNLQKVVTQEDSLAKFGRDFAELRGQDEHNAILAVLRGVAISEALYGAGKASGANGLGGQSFVDASATDNKYGFYVDLGSAKNVVDATATIQGAARAEGFLQAFGKAYKDYEPEFAYLITSPETVASLRSANLVDQDRVQDGNINLQTIFNGKFRLIQTRATQSLSTAELAKLNTGSGVDIVGTKTSFIVLPGAIAMRPLMIDEPVEIQRQAAKYKGGGTTEIWHRWGYVAHPAGYSWVGNDNAFTADADYMKVIENAAYVGLTDATDGLITGSPAYVQGVWKRKTSSALSLGILPVFHS
jgi:hypothetical protein